MKKTKRQVLAEQAKHLKKMLAVPFLASIFAIGLGTAVSITVMPDSAFANSDGGSGCVAVCGGDYDSDDDDDDDDGVDPTPEPKPVHALGGGGSTVDAICDARISANVAPAATSELLARIERSLASNARVGVIRNGDNTVMRFAAAKTDPGFVWAVDTEDGMVCWLPKSH